MAESNGKKRKKDHDEEVKVAEPAAKADHPHKAETATATTTAATAAAAATTKADATAASAATHFTVERVFIDLLNQLLKLTGSNQEVVFPGYPKEWTQYDWIRTLSGMPKALESMKLAIDRHNLKNIIPFLFNVNLAVQFLQQSEFFFSLFKEHRDDFMKHFLKHPRKEDSNLFDDQVSQFEKVTAE